MLVNNIETLIQITEGYRTHIKSLSRNTKVKQFAKLPLNIKKISKGMGRDLANNIAPGVIDSALIAQDIYSTAKSAIKKDSKGTMLNILKGFIPGGNTVHAIASNAQENHKHKYNLDRSLDHLRKYEPGSFFHKQAVKSIAHTCNQAPELCH